MRCFVMFVTAVCILFLLMLKWPKNKCFIVINFFLIRSFADPTYTKVRKGTFGIRDLTKIRRWNWEKKIYIDGIRDLTAPREA